MKKIELIIFDLDGTLIDSRLDITNGVNFALKKAGLRPKEVSEISSYIGRGVQDLIRRSLGDENKRFFKETLGIFEEYFKMHGNDSSYLYPNVKEILEHFKDKHKVVITNRKHAFAVSALQKLGVGGYFKEVMGGDDLSCMKPSACPTYKIIDKLNIKDKDRAIIVGDMDIDVITGRNAGILTCAVTYGIGDIEDIKKAGPDYLINDISELKNIIG
jgi:phosphoglycolate phosphatase